MNKIEIMLSETVTAYSHPIVLIHDDQIILIIGLSGSGNSQIIAVRGPLDTDAVSDLKTLGCANSGSLVPILSTSYSMIASNVVNDADMNTSAMVMDDGTIFIAYFDNDKYRFKKLPYNGTDW
ncbi:hypothetical protein B4Q13_20365, partial [Lacticaseibacillus rhamnosus]